MGGVVLMADLGSIGQGLRTTSRGRVLSGGYVWTKLGHELKMTARAWMVNRGCPPVEGEAIVGGSITII